MADPRRGLGARGEALARRHLERLGHRVLEANYRCTHGEVDLVTLDGDCLVFVEVRTRRGDALGSPEESLTPRKRDHLRAVAEAYRQERGGLPAQWRIDLVSVAMDRRGRLVRVEHLPYAVGEG